jgi:hypothetical protein
MGYSFQPGADVSMNGPGGAAGKSLPAPTSATKVLSFRMPKQAPSGALAPSALLNASGAGGVQSGGLSPQLLAMLLQAFSAPQQGGPFGGGGGGSQSPMSPSSSPSFGPPRVTPGDQGDRIRYDGPESQGPLGPPGDFFDRSQPAAPMPMAPSAPQGDPFQMGQDYQSYGMMPDLFR